MQVFVTKNAEKLIFVANLAAKSITKHSNFI